MKRTYIITVAAALIFIGALLLLQEPPKEIFVGDVPVQVEIADTEQKHAQGLSHRESLGENRGMLFVFENPGQYGFWMKDMNFPLDIVFFDKEKAVIDIKENMSPESYPNVFSPSADILYALEVNAGFVQKHGVKLGDALKGL